MDASPYSNNNRSARLSFTEGIYTPDLSDSLHAHKQAGLYFVLQGMHTVTCRQKSYLAEAGALVFHPAEEPHQCSFPAEAKLFEIYLKPLWLDQLRPHLPMLAHPSNHGTGALTPLATRAYQEFRLQDAFSSLALEGLVLEILAGIARSTIRDVNTVSYQPPRWLREARDLLHERFVESLSLEEIAQAVGVHPAHLGRMFRRYYHSTVGEYLRDLRLQSACRMLSTSSMPLVEIALACGYADQSNFTNAFKRYSGLTPREYRKIFQTRSS